jgi:4'-phosphopantetheinyl transferase
MYNPIYWMLVDTHQTVPEAQGVLSGSELEKFSAFRFSKRRDEWLLGRWTAKSLAHSLPGCQHYPLNQIEILNTREGAPYIHLADGTRPGGCLTISHSGSQAMCALTTIEGLRVGADLEKIEARTETFILDYFTAVEYLLVESTPPESRAEVVTLIWSAKESMLKALGVGLRVDTRSVEVQSMQGVPCAVESNFEWNKIQVREQKSSGRFWAGWWQRRGQFLLTLTGFAATQAEIQAAQLIQKQVER